MLWAPGMMGEVRANPVPMDTTSPPGRSDWTVSSDAPGGRAKRRKLIGATLVTSGSRVRSVGLIRRTNSMALTNRSFLSTAAITITCRSTWMMEASLVVSKIVSRSPSARPSAASEVP